MTLRDDRMYVPFTKGSKHTGMRQTAWRERKERKSIQGELIMEEGTKAVNGIRTGVRYGKLDPKEELKRTDLNDNIRKWLEKRAKSTKKPVQTKEEAQSDDN